MRAVVLVLVLVLTCGCAAIPQVHGTPKQRETVYAVIGTFVAMAVLAALLVPGPAHAMPPGAHEPAIHR